MSFAAHAPLYLPAASGRALPPAARLAALAFVVVLVPTYWWHYGPVNLLWFSTVALMLGVAGVVLDRGLPISMAAVGVLVFEIGWTADFLVRLVAGRGFGLTDYLYDPAHPLWVRLLTLYHLLLVPGLWWLTGRYGYDRRALRAWLALAGAVLLAIYLFGDPERNVNFAFGPWIGAPQSLLPPAAYVALWMLFLTLVVWLPTHRMLSRFRPAA